MLRIKAIVIIVRNIEYMPGRYRKRGRYSNAKKLNTVFKMARNTRRMMSGESKFNDVQVEGGDAAVAELVILVTDVDQESTVSSSVRREGDMIYAKSLTIRYHVKWTDNDFEAICRVLVVQKMGHTPAKPTIAAGSVDDVLQVSAPQILAPPHFPNRKQWKILSDDMYVGDPQRLENLVVKKFFKLKHKVYYNSATATAGDLLGNIYIIFFSDQATAANAPQIDMSARLVYKDF